MLFPFGIDLQLATKKGPILTMRGLDITCTQEHIVEVIIFFRSVEQKRRAGGGIHEIMSISFFSCSALLHLIFCCYQAFILVQQ